MSSLGVGIHLCSILKALVSDAQELKIVGCKMPKAFKTVPQKALQELEEFMAQQGAFIYQHIEYVVPQQSGTLSTTFVAADFGAEHHGSL